MRAINEMPWYHVAKTLKACSISSGFLFTPLPTTVIRKDEQSITAVAWIDWGSWEQYEHISHSVCVCVYVCVKSKGMQEEKKDKEK